MSDYLTGRRRRWGASGTFSLDSFGKSVATSGTYNQLAGIGSIEFDLAGLQLNASVTGGCGTNTGPTGCSANVEAQVPTVTPVTATNTIYAFMGAGSGGGATAGSFSFAIDLEEWAADYTPTTSAPVNGTTFPNYGGAEQGDCLPAMGREYYELPRIGGNITISITLHGVTATVNVTITPTIQAAIGGIDYQLYVKPHTSFDWFHGSSSGNFSHTYATTWAATVDGVAWAVPGASWTSGGCVLDFASGMICSAPASSTGPTVVCEGVAAMQAPTSFTLDGRLLAFKNNFPTSGHTLTIQNKYASTLALTLNPDGTAIWSQNKYAAGGNLNGYVPPSIGLDETSPVACYLSSLGDDDTRDWRCMFRGYKWDAVSLTHDSSLVIDPCTSLAHWSAGAHTTLSLVGGNVHAAASGGAGSLSLAVQSAVRVWEMFRYLQIKGVGSTPMTLTLSLAGQSWSFTIGASLTDATVDLCCAGSESGTMEPKQSRLPINDPGPSPTATDPLDQYKLGWGVNFCDSLTISGIPDGASLTLEGISLVCSSDLQKQMAITFLEPFLHFLTAWSSPTDHTTQQPFCFLETDYRICDLAAMSLVTPISGSPPTYVYYSITQFQALLAYFPSLTAVLMTLPTDGYHTDDDYMLKMGGNGATFDWGTDRWTDWVDYPIGTGVNLPCQDLWDEIIVYPGAGNVWPQDGHFNINTPLKVSKSLRAQGWGLVFRLDDTPGVGANIKVYETAHTGVLEGTGVSNGLGYYQTGLPNAFGNVDSTVELVQDPVAHLTHNDVLQNRERFRTSFRRDITTGLKGVFYDVGRDQSHWRSFVYGGTAWVGRCPNSDIKTSWSDADTGLPATVACVRVERFGQGQRLGLLLVSGGSITVQVSTDKGATWGMATTLGSGTYANLHIGTDGRWWCYWLDGTDIKGAFLDAAFNVVKSAFVAISSVDSTGFDVHTSDVTGGGRRIAIVYSASGTVTVKSSTDGITFT